MFQLLFVVHGMGAGARAANDAVWSKELVAALKRDAGAYKHADDVVTSAPKAKQVLVVPITYHQFFDDIRTRWAQQSGDEAAWLPLLKGLALTEPALLPKLPDWVATAGHFFWTHVLDVLLYRYVNEFRAPIRDAVATQIADAWHKADLANGARTPVHFLAHSLGTSVLHDALAFLGSDPGFSSGTHAIASVLTCANVTSVLETNFPTYGSIDRPVDADPPPDGMTDAFFSFRHELDPIAAVKAFRGDLHGWPAAGYRDEVTIDVKDWNLHGAAHYAANPVVHLRLFERLWPTEPWAGRRDEAIKRYQASPGTPCPAALATLRQELKRTLSEIHGETPVQLLETASRTVRAIADARTACGVEGGIA